MTLPVQELLNYSDLLFETEIISAGPYKEDENAQVDPDEDEDTFEETYGDLEDGHDDLNEPESDRGVDNLE